MNLKVGGDVPFNGDGDIILGLQPKHQNQVQSWNLLNKNKFHLKTDLKPMLVAASAAFEWQWASTDPIARGFLKPDEANCAKVFEQVRKQPWVLGRSGSVDTDEEAE